MACGSITLLHVVSKKFSRAISGTSATSVMKDYVARGMCLFNM